MLWGGSERSEIASPYWRLAQIITVSPVSWHVCTHM